MRRRSLLALPVALIVSVVVPFEGAASAKSKRKRKPVEETVSIEIPAEQATSFMNWWVYFGGKTVSESSLSSIHDALVEKGVTVG